MPTNTRRYLSAAKTAAVLRKALKAAHPGVKFSVRSQTYAGGSSISVGWADGPTEPHVEQTTELYRGATFDRQTDCRAYHDTLLSTDDGAELVHFAPHYVSCQRTLSSDFRAELENEIAEVAGESYAPNKPYRVAAVNADGTDAPATLYYADDASPTYGTDLVARLAENRPR